MWVEQHSRPPGKPDKIFQEVIINLNIMVKQKDVTIKQKGVTVKQKDGLDFHFYYPYFLLYNYKIKIICLSNIFRKIN